MRRVLRPRADRRQLDALHSALLAELRTLKRRVPHLAGGLVASVDGLLIVHDTHDTEADSLAALTAATLGVARRLAETTGQGEFRDALVHGEHGYVASYAAGPLCVLTLLAHPDTSVGRLHLEARRAAGRVAELVHTELAPPSVT
ncbi:roadblock/LC7 domain-containing protein [Kitasatospora sp. NPDC058965]|uniref:roadblock/LC7 domain-containing protein n=1 Tax=Kitasatospora sp. NPDC058965 TaxID=3346682 RepID=UPI00367BEA12